MKFTWLIMGLVLVLISVPVSAQDASADTYEKVIILHYHIKGNNVTYLDAKVIYGYPPNFHPYGDFTGKTLGAGDAQLRTFGIGDARITYTETGAIIKEEANFSVSVPYSADLNAVGIYDPEDDSLLAKTEVKGVVADFCRSHPEDPDCKTGIALPPTMLIAAAVLIGVCILVGGWFFLKRGRGA